MLNKYLDKNMNDVDWAIAVEKMVEEQKVNSYAAINKITELREEYQNFRKGLGATKQKETITEKQLMTLHRQEADELFRAFLNKDNSNFEEECWDVIQTVLNMMDYKEIDMRESLLKHKLKLNSRGREFKENIILVL